jgi:alanine dehydrogenase
MVLLLSDADVMQAIGGADAVRRSIDLMERCFLDEAHGETCLWPKTEIMYPATASTRAESELSLHAVLGIVPGLDAIGGRIFTSGRTPERRAAAANERQWKLLFDFKTLNLVCLMQDVSVHPYLVGAHVGVATRWLAREDAHTVAVLGSGKMALGSLRAICAVRPIREARVYSPTPAHRAAFAERAAKELDIEVSAVDAAEIAVRGADIVSCATNTDVRGGQAVYAADWLAPGMHVNTIARWEADEASFMRAKVVPASLAGTLGMEPPQEPFASLMQQGAIPEANLVGDLPQIVAGARLGRRSAEDITLYIGPSLGTQHAALVAWVYEEARRQGLGQEWQPPIWNG